MSVKRVERYQWDIQTYKSKITDNAMAKKEKTNRQTIAHKTQHRKLKR